MVNHKEILRLKSLGLTHREITDATGCGRNTVTRTLARAREQKLSWQQAQTMSQQEVSRRLFPTEQKNPVYKMPDYEWVHREMQKSGVTLSLLWVEYCEQCRQSGELPYGIAPGDDRGRTKILRPLHLLNCRESKNTDGTDAPNH